MVNKILPLILSIVILHVSLISAQTIKFHPIGDSTTEAYELESSWRYWFYKKMRDNGFDNVDFVGSRNGTNMGTSFSDNDWDMDHDGHTSSTASQVLNGGLAHSHSGNIKIWAPQYIPNIAIIYLGTNDIRQGRSSSDIVKTFEDIIQVLRDARAEVKIVVCQIPDWSYSGYGGSQAGVDGLNALIPSIANLGTTISPIKIVDLNTDYAVSDHRDGIHPGPTGAPKIANRIYEAVEPWLNENTDPSIKITSPVAGTTFEEGTDITISAEASSTEGTITQVEFLNGTTILGQASASPYSYVWQNVQAGEYSIIAKASNDKGSSSQSSVNIKVIPPQEPFGGTPHAIPGKIEFENFDVCGNGCAYYDDSPGTSVPTPPNYRADEDVDIENCDDGGYNIGYGKAGEWLEYTVDVAVSGTYDIEFRVACDGDGRTISLETDGVALATDVAIPNTGGWQTWQTLTMKDVELTAGEQVIRVTIGAANYVNLNNMTFVSKAVETPPTIEITSPADKSEFATIETIAINATALATDATIVDVKFYANNELLYTDNTAPYSYDWSGMAIGNHVIKVVATDSKDSQSSDEITVSVIKASLNLQLKAGWNMVGCPLSGSTDIETALSSIWNQVETVKDFDGFWNVASDPVLNSLNSLEWGKGYYIKVKSPCNLQW